MLLIEKVRQSSLTTQVNLYKVARYISVVIRNCQKIDQVKSTLFNEELSINQLFQSIDTTAKGYIDQNDIFKLVQSQGADRKAFQIQKIMRYFGSIKKITKGHFLKTIALPPWKINPSTKKLSNKQQFRKQFFKFLVSLYLAIDQDDVQRIKIKNISFQEIFYYVSTDGDVIRIDQISTFLNDKKFNNIDAFNLLRFMHNRITLNLQEFKKLFTNNLPQRFQLQDSNLNNFNQVKSQCKQKKKYE